MTREKLEQYVDLQKEIEELKARIKKTESEIERIEEEGTVKDKVMGGLGGLQSFKIEGYPTQQLSRKRTLLYSRKATLASLEMEVSETLNQVEEFIASIEDSRMRRIINLRYIENLPWNKVADKIGGGNTEDSIRMAFNRFMK